MGVCSKLCLWDSPGAAAAALSASPPPPPRGARTREASSGDVRAEAPRLPGTESGRDLPAGLRLQPCELGSHPSNPGPTASSGGTAAAARPDSASPRAQVVPAGARPLPRHRSRAAGSSGFRSGDVVELTRAETSLGRGWGGEGRLPDLEGCDLSFAARSSAMSREQLSPSPTRPSLSSSSW